MYPDLREILEDADSLVEAVIEEQQQRMNKGDLVPYEKKHIVHSVLDLQLARSYLQKVIHG